MGIYPTIDKNPDYEIMGGLIIMNLSINHLLNLDQSSIPHSKHRDLISFTKSKNRFKSKLIITNILPGSYIKSINNLKPGDIIKSVDGNEINELEDFRNMIIKNIIKKNNKKYISFETESSTLLLIDIDRIIEEDNFLSRKYKYNLSITHNKLKKIKNGNFNESYQLKYPVPYKKKKNKKSFYERLIR